MEIRRMTADVVISGSGVMGLMMAEKLSRYQVDPDHGLDILVMEKARTLASGASVRNEGWLHAGTYHALAIEDLNEARSVVERTQFGYEKILQLAPQVIEDPTAKTFALMHDKNTVDTALERWLELNVPFREVNPRELEERIPNLEQSYVAAGFEVDDRSINTRTLYQHLRRICRGRGVRFMTGMHIGRFRNERDAVVFSTESGDKIADLSSEVYVHTAGYGMQYILDLLGQTDKMRYWKSHLAVSPQIMQDNIFFLEPGEVGIMNHLDLGGTPKSVIGTNQDTSGFLEYPNFEAEKEKGANLIEAGRRIFKNWNDLKSLVVYACVKTDLGPEDSIQTLSPSFRIPLPNHICLLPGKMTEAPYVADKFGSWVAARIAIKIINTRPYNFDQAREIDMEIDDISQRPLDLANFSIF